MARFRKHLICSVSGGRSSALAAILVKRWPKRYKYRSVQYVFANTGLEHPNTITFLKNLENYLQAQIVKLEFDFDANGYKYNIIENWESINMTGEPFKRAIQYEQRNVARGLPHMKQPYCSSLMKKDIIRKYAKESLSTVKYAQCIGYRAEDMPKRISWPEMAELGNAYIFPLLTHYKEPVGLKRLDQYWRKMPFRLELPAHLGNCILCWKKSDKNIDLALRSGQAQSNVQFWHDMETLHGNTSFRGRRSIADMIEQSDMQLLIDDTNGDNCNCSVSFK